MKPPPPPPPRELPPEKPPELLELEKPPLRELLELELEPKLELRVELDELEVVGVVERVVPNEPTRLVLLVTVPLL